MAQINEQELALVSHMAQEIRIAVIRMLAEAGSGHLAGSLDMADIMAALYFYVLRHNPEDPDWSDRDRLVLSCGHIAPVRYAAMALAGYFSPDELTSLRRFGSRLQGHPERTRLPGIETTSGPLGDGLPQAIGMALAARMDGVSHHTFVITSDAEHQAGILWEAVMFAGARSFGNLTNIIDRNGIQIGGATEEVLPLEPLIQKYEAFGWRVIDVDGHNIEMFVEAVESARMGDRPTAIIAHTIPGKGVPDIEGDYRWHGNVPTHEQAEAWVQHLREHP